jgi:6-pyruvoyltetrahydropterin/6-carboxytetrahydropterin synthase
MFRVTKKYGHDLGLSVAFRQWRASHSHCQRIHGYSLAFEFGFVSPDLNNLNWVIDYGDLNKLKNWLKDTFDHTTLVAQDDPHFDKFKDLADNGLIKMVVLPHVGCEKVAELVGLWVVQNIIQNPNVVKAGGAKLEYVTVAEHLSNSSTWSPPFDLMIFPSGEAAPYPSGQHTLENQNV